MKKFLALLLTLAMCVCLFAACGGDAPTTTPATNETTQPAGDGKLTGTLKLGMIGPLTGGAALYGNAVGNACTIAVDEINAKGGLKIELNNQDDEHDAEKSVNAYNNLKDWGVQAIVGCVTTTPCVAVSAEAYGDRMFMLTPSASSTSVTEGKDNMFQLCFTDPGQGTTAANYIKNKNLAQKVAVIYNNADAYSTGIYEAFNKTAADLGIEVVSVTTFTDDTATDFSVQLTEAKNAGADFIFLPIYYTPASLIMKQADTMGYKVTFFGVDGMDGILTLEGFDTSLAEGTLVMTPFNASDAAAKSFVDKYVADYKETPSQFAADGYDCVYAIYNALTYYAEKNGGLDVTGKSYTDLCQILISVFTDPAFSSNGLTGSGMTWTANGEVNKEPIVVVIKDGTYVNLG